jgi:GNAT superfamily N-acetyltransferase
LCSSFTRGVGRALVEAALEWGQQRGCAEADLGVPEESPARSLYEQLGFRTFRRQMRLWL